MGFPLKQASLYANDGVAELEKLCSDAVGVQVDCAEMPVIAS